LVTQTEYDGQSNAKKKKKKEEVQNIESDEKDNSSEESRSDSPVGGGGDEVNQEEGGEEGDKQEKGEATHQRIPSLQQKHHRRGRFPQRNLQQERRHAPISLNRRMCSQWTM
jgi:hypothetical protein